MEGIKFYATLRLREAGCITPRRKRAKYGFYILIQNERHQLDSKTLVQAQKNS